MRRIIIAGPRLSTLSRRLLCNESVTVPVQQKQHGRDGASTGASPVVYSVTPSIGRSSSAVRGLSAAATGGVPAIAVTSSASSVRDSQEAGSLSGATTARVESDPHGPAPVGKPDGDDTLAPGLEHTEPPTSSVGQAATGTSHATEPSLEQSPTPDIVGVDESFGAKVDNTTDDNATGVQGVETSREAPVASTEGPTSDARALCDTLRTLAMRNAARQLCVTFHNALKEDDPNLVDAIAIRIAMPVLARISWTSTVSNTLDFVQKHNLEIPSVTYNCALHALSGSAEPGKLKEIIDTMWSLPPTSHPNAASYNSLIGAYFYKSKPDDAFSVLQDMKNRMVYPAFSTYHTLIAGCVRVREARRAYETFLAVEQQRFEMSALTVGQVLVACAENDDADAVVVLAGKLDDALPRYGMEIERLAERRASYRMPEHVRTSQGDRTALRGEPKLEIAGIMAVLHAAYRTGRPDVAERGMAWAEQWYPEYSLPVSAWCCLVGSYAASGDFSNAFLAVARMREAGHSLSLREARDCLVRPLSKDVAKIDEQFYALVDKLAPTSGQESASEGVSGGTSGFIAEAKSEREDEAPMESTAAEGEDGNSLAESEITSDGAETAPIGETEGAEQEPNSEVDSSSSSLRDAVLREPDTSSSDKWVSNSAAESAELGVGIEEMNCIIAACSMAGDLDRAFQTYDEVHRLGLERNTDTYNALLLGCVTTRHVRGGLRVEEEMRETGIPRDEETVFLIVRLLVRVGRFDQAIALVSDESDATVSLQALQSLARVLMRKGRLADVRKVIAIGESRGLTDRAILARIEGPYVRDIPALDGTEESIPRSSDHRSAVRHGSEFVDAAPSDGDLNESADASGVEANGRL